MNTTSYIFPNNNILEAGIDESNRGGLIGNVVTACVVLKKAETEEEFNIYNQIKDSKKLTKKKRKELAVYIKENAITYGIAEATVEEIDNINILNATLKAMYRATDIAYKKVKFDKILIDGPYYKPYIPSGEDSEVLPYECINKGDSLYTCIAAASILAKEQHTENMVNLVENNKELEKYDLLNNQGYGTKKHLNAINEYGISKWHRKTYKCCQNI
jgi:ribonuclease HII